mgnify:CR=1 FL=1
MAELKTLQRVLAVYGVVLFICRYQFGLPAQTLLLLLLLGVTIVLYAPLALSYRSHQPRERNNWSQISSGKGYRAALAVGNTAATSRFSVVSADCGNAMDRHCMGAASVARDAAPADRVLPVPGAVSFNSAGSRGQPNCAPERRLVQTALRNRHAVHRFPSVQFCTHFVLCALLVRHTRITDSGGSADGQHAEVGVVSRVQAGRERHANGIGR